MGSLKKTVNETYEHIVAILIIGLIFVGAVVVMPSLSFSNLQNVDQQQLRNTALNVFNTILLESGQGMNGTEVTNDWGSISPWNSSNVKKFGLASSDESIFYKLDPDKVQRLESSILGNISITQLKELMGLQAYGLRLRIIPPFSVTNTDGSLLTDNSPISINGNLVQYAIKVSYLDGRPIPNAEIWAKAVYSDKNTFDMTNPTTYYTNALGFFEGSAVLEFEPNFVTLILRITVADVATLVVTTGENSIDSVDVGLVGDDVTLRIEEPEEGGTTPNTFVNEIYVVGGSEDVWKLYEGSNTNDDMFNPGEGNFEFWSETFPGLDYHDPILLILNLNTVPKGDESPENGRQDIVVAGPYQKLLGYSVFEFGNSDDGSHASVRVQRNVIISGMTYTAEILLWKE
jgi:hypothetical protein